MTGLRATIDWMYCDPKVLAASADYRKTSIANAKRLRGEFFAKAQVPLR